MKRLVAEHFKLNGQPKRKFKSRGEAMRVANNNQHAYSCGFCGDWHLATNRAVRSRR